MLVDTHAHLFWESYDTDREEVLKRAVDNGVTTIVNVGVDVELSQIAASLTTNKLQMYSTIGIHPQEAIKYKDNLSKLQTDILELEKIYLENPEKVILVGECGLDYFFENNPDWNPEQISPQQVKELQKELLQAQIDLANKYNLPLSIHCRDSRSTDPNMISDQKYRSDTRAWEDIFKITKNSRGILHCYSGLDQDYENALNSNFFISFAGNLTYPKNTSLRETAKKLPLEKILLETDCPFLAPQSIRGQRNEPSSIKEIAQIIADLRGISFEEVARQTTENFNRLIKKSI